MLYWQNIFHEIERQVDVDCQENLSFLHVMVRNYQFMYTAPDLRKA